MQPIDSDKHNVQSPDRQKLTEKKKMKAFTKHNKYFKK